jgi:hypothetical protein
MPPTPTEAISVAASRLPQESILMLSALCKRLREQTIRLIAVEECLKSGWDAFYQQPTLRFTSVGIESVFEQCKSIPIGPQALEETLAFWRLLLNTETTDSRHHAAYLCWVAETNGEENKRSFAGNEPVMR